MKKVKDIKKYNAKYYQEHKDTIKKQSAQFKKDNPEKQKKYLKKFYAKYGGQANYLRKLKKKKVNKTYKYGKV